MRKIATCSPPTSAHTPMSATMSSDRQTRTGIDSCDFKFGIPFFRARRANLAALGDEDHAAVRLVAVHEVGEAAEEFRCLDRFLPFTLIGVDMPLHVGLELGAQAERVFAHHLAQVIDAALEIVEPDARALQPVCRADVEHQEAVYVANK